MLRLGVQFPPLAFSISCYKKTCIDLITVADQNFYCDCQKHLPENSNAFSITAVMSFGIIARLCRVRDYVMPNRKSCINAFLKITCCVLLCLAAYFVYSACQAIRGAIRSERERLSALFVCDLVREFVADQGKWPKSWQELEIYEYTNDIHQWPKDSELVKSRVSINFQINLKDLNLDSLEHLDAIRCENSWYDFKKSGQYHDLTESLKKVIESNGKRVKDSS